MQNGTLGEARTRAFLANRFWVLERSVDVHGADFLIQINSLATSVLDKRPPRFGIVQAKFVQSGATTVRIPSSYLSREDGSLSDEFFLIICTGYGDDERMFLLDAAQIDKEFDSKTSKKSKKVIRSKKAAHFLNRTNYEVTGARNDALNRIERALRNASFSSNRFWLTDLGYARKAPSITDVYYYPVLATEDLPNNFDTWKREARNVLRDLEEIAIHLQDVIAATLPMELEKVTKELDAHIDHSNHISFRAPGNMADFYEAVRHHDRMVGLLSSAGVEGSWRLLAEQGQRVTLGSLPTLPNEPSNGLHFAIDYDPKTLAIYGFKVTPENKYCGGRYPWFIDPANKPGHSEVCIRADIAHLTVDRPTYSTTLTHALSLSILPVVLGLEDLDDA